MPVPLTLKNPLSFFFAPSRRDQFLARYVVRELGRGRALADVLADPYVVNRSTDEERGRLVERPDVVEAAGDRAVADLKRAIGAGRVAAGAAK